MVRAVNVFLRWSRETPVSVAGAVGRGYARGRLATLTGGGGGEPVNLTAPSISGTPQVGGVLSTTNGTWTNSPTAYAYKWQRSANGVSGWADISGATSATYLLTASDLGAYVRGAVLASNTSGAAPGGYVSTASSAQVTAASGPSTTFDAFYAPTFALTPLSNDAIPIVAKPAKSSSLATAGYIDPVYGTRVYRATNYASDVSGATLSHLRHEYSRKLVWNATSTRYIAQASNGFWHLYDANTFQRLPRSGTLGALAGLAGDCEPTWHPTDPNKLWYTGLFGGTTWWEKDVENDTDTVLFTFSGRHPFTTASKYWFKSEGRPSIDGRYWGFRVDNVSNGYLGLMTYDRQTDTILGSQAAAAHGGNVVDHVSMSCSGQYFVPSWAYVPAYGTRAYALDFSSFRVMLPESVHSDLGVGPNGEDMYVYFDDVSTSPDTGFVVAQNIATGSTIRLFSHYPAPGEATAGHVSCCAFDRRGWALISTYADYSNYTLQNPSANLRSIYRKIFAVELKTGGRVLNVAHTRTAANFGGYFGEPQASVNRDFTRIMFATNFNDGTGNIDSYMIGLPSTAIPA